MIVNDDGSFYLEQGEIIPFLCPQCGWPTPHADVQVVTCGHCGHTATAAEFSEGKASFEPAQ